MPDGTPGKETRISDFPHPHPRLKTLPKEIIKYKRDDGVELNGTLYTPPGYDAERDGPPPFAHVGVSTRIQIQGSGVATPRFSLPFHRHRSIECAGVARSRLCDSGWARLADHW